MIKDEDELKSMLEYCELLNNYKEELIKKKHPQLNKSISVNELMSEYRESILNPNTTSIINNSTKEKMMCIKLKYTNSLQYPFDWLIDYVISIYDIFDKLIEKEAVLQRIEAVRISL
jgi:hypothetical protein